MTEQIPADDAVARVPQGPSKHERAVAHTLGMADHAAVFGDHAEALAWLDTLEAIGVQLPRTYAFKRLAWAHARARRAELNATRDRLLVVEPAATKRMLALTEDLEDLPEKALLLDRALEGAMALMGTDLGNVQVAHPADGVLTIAASSGFDREFLEYFAVVADDSSACGRAVAQRSQTVIADVNEDPGFASHREIAAASGFGAVQSSPIVDPAGRLHGVISTHFRGPHRPPASQMQLIAWYCERVGAALTLYDQTATVRPIR